MIKNKFILYGIFIIAIIPHFPYYSYGIARVFDAITLIALFFLYLIIDKKNIRLSKDISILMRLIYLYILIIFVSNLVGVIYVTTGLDNLAELYRPLLWFISLLIGFYISSNEKEILSLFKLVISVTIFSAIIAYLEKFLVTQLYFLYSGGAHYQSNRATGICQDFGDYCLLQTIGCFSSYYIYRVTSDKKYLLIIFFLASSVLLSTSKAGLGLLLIALIFIFKDFINNGKVNIISKLFILLAVLFLSIYAYQYIVNNDKMYNEILDVLNFDIDLPSIYYRLEDLNIVIEKFNNSNIISNLFGIGTNKGDPKSYIEVASLSIIYKTGILGFIFYYSIYLYVIVIFYKKNRTKLLSFIILSIILIDFAAAMSNRLLGIMFLFIIIGGLIRENSFNIDRNLVKK